MELKQGLRVGDASAVVATETLCDILPTPDSASDQPDWQATLDQINIASSLTPHERQQLCTLLHEYQDIISRHSFDLGRTDILMHRIDTGNATPIKCRPYRHSITEQKELERQVSAFLEAGLIRESTSPWSAPVVMVRKKDGSWRFCVDYRRLNSVTKRDSMPLPRVDDTLHRLHSSKYFSTLDFSSGFYQVLTEKSSREKTAFATQTGLYEFNVMPMGLTNAPASFQRLVSHMLRPLQWKHCLPYLDDCIIFSATFSDHLSHLRSVFQVIRDAGLKLKPSKCTFAELSVEFLGHIVSGDGIRPDPRKIAVVANWPAPRNVRELRSFLGLASYYRRFIHNFSMIAKPLNALLKQSTSWSWGAEQEAAFQSLVARLCSQPVLAFPDHSQPFLLSTDASGSGIGAILKQKDAEDREHVIAYASRSLTPAETRYTVTELECLACVYGINQFRQFLFGKHFYIITDHCALCFLMKIRNPNGRLARWALLLQDFSFDIMYKSGKSHKDADALSRLPETAAQALVVTRSMTGSATASGPSPNPDVDEDKKQGSASTDRVASVLTSPPDKATLIQHQKLDREFKQIVSMLTQQHTSCRSIPRRLRRYRLVNDVLYYCPASPVNRSQQLCVPASCRALVLSMLHDAPVCGHLGLQRTWQRARERFYWPRMWSDVRDYVASCVSCSEIKASKQRPVGLLQPLTPALVPFARIGTDTVGPFKRSSRGNRFIVTITDYCTKTAIACATRENTAKAASHVLLHHVILRYGFPHEVLSDRGSEFVASLYQETLKAFNITARHSTAMHPRTNGQTERFHHCLASMISHYVSSDQHDWDRFLPFLLFAYNTSTHESTGYSPFFLLHGFHARSDVDDAFDYSSSVSEETALQRLKYLRTARRLVAERLYLVREKMRERFDVHRRPNPFRVGDLVWIKCIMHQPGNARKLEKQFKGPFRLVSHAAVNDFIIEDSNGRRDTVNVERLKPFYPRPQRLQLPDRVPFSACEEETSSASAARALPLSPPALAPATEDDGDGSDGDVIGSMSPFVLRRSTRTRRSPDRFKAA